MIDILRLSLPITLWITGFSAIYALQGLTCSRNWPDDLDARLVLFAAWAVAIALQALCLMALWKVRSASRFVQAAAITIAVAALIAAIWTTMPVLVISACS